jgi:hypothetical protein
MLTTAACIMIVYETDFGGPIADRMAEMASHDCAYAITADRCESACTFYLDPDRLACVAPDTVFGFHGPMPGEGRPPLTPERFDELSQLIASHYPPEIAGPYLRDWRHGEVEMRGQSIIDAGLAAECRWLGQAAE